MNQENYNELLNNVLELEGLLRLYAVNSTDRDRICSLIAEKGNYIQTIAMRFSPAAGLVAPPEPRMPNEEDLREARMSIISDYSEEDDELYEAFSDEEEEFDNERVDTSPNPVTTAPNPIPPEVTSPPKMEDVTPPPIPSSPGEEPPLPTGGSSQKESDGRKLKALFPLNDFFRFRRELFDGSDVDFNASLCIVEELGSFDRAKDYFFNDLQWNPEDDRVDEFLVIIRKYFTMS